MEGAFQNVQRHTTWKIKQKVVELATFLEVSRKFNNNYNDLLLSALLLYLHVESMKNGEIEIPFLCFVGSSEFCNEGYKQFTMIYNERGV